MLLIPKIYQRISPHSATAHFFRSTGRHFNTRSSRVLAQSTYEILDKGSGEDGIRNSKNICPSPFYNQGTATPIHLRSHFRLHGHLTSKIESPALQKERAREFLRTKPTALEKYVFLSWLRNTNTHLFYQLLLENFEELLPIVYTPTVGEACLEFSRVGPFLAPPGVPDGLFLSLKDLPNLREIIRNYAPFPPDPSLTPQIAVITDGSRILGLGDLGANGMGIAVGKLQLYVAAAGIDPRRCLPICIDVGTDNEKYLADPLYLGLRQKRPNDKTFHHFVDQVLNEIYAAYPNILVQFEDFSSEHAFSLLESYQHKHLCFNDDIQGTGAVILAGFFNAVQNVASHVSPKDHRILFFGAGSAGVGVAKQLLTIFESQGMSEQEARERIWLVDSKGLVTVERGDKLAAHKTYFARRESIGKQVRSLLEAVDYVKPTALIGLSAVRGAFDKSILRRMGELNEKPIIFPLSNPLERAECTFEEAMKYTDNRAVFASGTKFPPYRVPDTKQELIGGQGNNLYLFPGLGLGAILSKSVHISDGMINVAAKGLAQSLTPEERYQKVLFPSLTRIRRVSAEVAAATCIESVRAGLARDPEIHRRVQGLLERHTEAAWNSLVEFVESKMWNPWDGYGMN
ncbi:uncharacterized protein VTP21DRAFT_9214 [Calcarisporiella thermophila]|uniref:uncharacterized protein n=1 Tax=Calcarisporiella thermophila TaxID=911321 RepID=UPI003743A33B